MFIEITKEAVEMATSINEATNTVWLNINDALRSMLYRSHITFIDRKSLKILMLQPQLDPANKIVLKWIANHFNDLNAIGIKSKIRLILTADSTAHDESFYYIQINQRINFNNARLLAEDESDYAFYSNIFSAMNDSKMVSIKIDNIPYHGGHVKNAMITQNASGYFTLCVVDSDKDFPKDEVGDTCKQAIQTAKQLEFSEVPLKVYVLGVREKENLFPFTQYVLQNHSRQQFIKAILECCNESELKYIDIKDGINLNNSDEAWLKHYAPLVKKCKELHIPNNNGMIKGIGHKALEYACVTFFHNINYTFFQDTTDYSKIFSTQKYIIKEWKMLVQNMFDFGCCLSKSINFNV